MSTFAEPRTGVNRNGENAPRNLIRTTYRLGILIQSRAATVFLERDMKLSRFWDTRPTEVCLGTSA